MLEERAIMKISGVYKITNTVTGDFYIGSSKDVKHRWACHKITSKWKKCPNNPMYLDMKKYGVDKFELQILEKVESEKLKEKEQQFIEKLHPTYNRNRAKGWDIEKYKKYLKSDKRKEYMKEYHKSEKYKEYQKEYDNQPCYYNGETLTLAALSNRFRRAEIENPTKEAKQYLQNIEYSL